MITAEKKYIKVTSIQEAIHATKENKTTSRYLAGGTDLMANKFQGNENGTCLIDITGIDSLKKIKKEDGYYHLGPLVTLSEITKHPIKLLATALNAMEISESPLEEPTPVFLKWSLTQLRF